MRELRFFRKFNNQEQAFDLVQLFFDNDIKSRMIEVAPSLDATFIGGQLTSQFEIQLLQADFEKANGILENQAKDSINLVDKDHYLFSFSNKELFDILLKPDEWSEFDAKLAYQILKDRGEDVSPNLIQSLNKQRIEDLAKPEGNQKTWIMAGYLFSIVGGFLGIVIGWYIWKSTKTLPDGNKVLSYSDIDRKHGRTIFYLGIVILPIAFALRMYAETL